MVVNMDKWTCLAVITLATIFAMATAESVQTTSSCTNTTCQHNGTCYMHNNEATCKCTHWNYGPRCTEEDTCATHTCSAGFTCVVHQMICIMAPCPPGPQAMCVNSSIVSGYTSCESSENMCLNGGTCVGSLTEGFRCMCPSHFTGTYCQRQDPCDSMPCENGGRCRGYRGYIAGYFCYCAPGFVGKNCELKDPCLQNPCKNSGTCSPRGGNFHCYCAVGFVGTTCEQIGPCASNPCKNKGACLDYDNFYCECTVGFLGHTCEQIDHCLSSPCPDEIFCLNANNDYSCHCPRGLVGKNCEYKDLCIDYPCTNFGFCQMTDDGSSFTCDCQGGMTGYKCLVQVTDTDDPSYVYVKFKIGGRFSDIPDVYAFEDAIAKLLIDFGIPMDFLKNIMIHEGSIIVEIILSTPNNNKTKSTADDIAEQIKYMVLGGHIKFDLDGKDYFADPQQSVSIRSAEREKLNIIYYYTIPSVFSVIGAVVIWYLVLRCRKRKVNSYSNLGQVPLSEDPPIYSLLSEEEIRTEANECPLETTIRI